MIVVDDTNINCDKFVKGKLEESIMWLKDTGILNRVKDDVMIPPIPKPDPKVRHNEPLNLEQLGIILIILVVGLVMGLLAFLVELLMKPKFKSAKHLAQGFELFERHYNLGQSAVNGQNYLSWR